MPRKRLDDLDLTIAAEVTMRRKLARLTQSQAAEAMVVSVGQYNKYETGKTRIKARDLELIRGGLFDRFAKQMNLAGTSTVQGLEEATEHYSPPNMREQLAIEIWARLKTLGDMLFPRKTLAKSTR